MRLILLIAIMCILSQQGGMCCFKNKKPSQKYAYQQDASGKLGGMNKEKNKDTFFINQKKGESDQHKQQPMQLKTITFGDSNEEQGESGKLDGNNNEINTFIKYPTFGEAQEGTYNLNPGNINIEEINSNDIIYPESDEIIENSESSEEGEDK